MRKKSDDERQIDQLIKSLRICARGSSCANCMFKPIRDKCEEDSGKADFTCRSSLMYAAADFISDFLRG